MKLIYKKNGATNISTISSEDFDAIIDCYEQPAIKLNYLSEGNHLCGNCVCGHPDKCSKIADRTKKVLSGYEFIKDGYQVVDKTKDRNGLTRNDLVKFVVTKCDNYAYEEAKEISLEKLKMLKQELKKAYFGTETYDEAQVLQYDLEKRGNIYGIRGKKSTKEDVRLIKSNTKIR